MSLTKPDCTLATNTFGIASPPHFPTNRAHTARIRTEYTGITNGTFTYTYSLWGPGKTLAK